MEGEEPHPADVAFVAHVRERHGQAMTAEEVSMAEGFERAVGWSTWLRANAERIHGEVERDIRLIRDAHNPDWA
jgi:hypothetical protein